MSAFPDRIYEPPGVDTELVSDERVVSGGNGAHYVVSRAKFTSLYLLTFGIYEAVWFYQHWAHIKRRTGSALGGLFWLFYLSSAVLPVFGINVYAE